MSANSRKPNTQECMHFGRKLSNTVTDDIHTSSGYVVIGSDDDDEIYFGESLGPDKEMMKNRVMLSVFDENYSQTDIDLEDILRFSAKYCRGIVLRVLEETKEE